MRANKLGKEYHFEKNISWKRISVGKGYQLEKISVGKEYQLEKVKSNRNVWQPVSLKQSITTEQKVDGNSNGKSDKRCKFEL